MGPTDVTEPSLVDRYRRSFDATWSDDAPIEHVRFVALDSETTGLNPRTDRLITIGAVAVQDGEIVLDDSFGVLLRIARNTSAVTVHGMTRDESRSGIDEPEAIERLLTFLRDGVVVGHHINHDIDTLNAACERHWGFELVNRSLDTMDLTLHLERSGTGSDGRCSRRIEASGRLTIDDHSALRHSEVDLDGLAVTLSTFARSEARQKPVAGSRAASIVKATSRAVVG
jgi:DNA polymerase III epsilon subunit-like protein